MFPESLCLVTPDVSRLVRKNTLLITVNVSSLAASFEAENTVRFKINSTNRIVQMVQIEQIVQIIQIVQINHVSLRSTKFI